MGEPKPNAVGIGAYSHGDVLMQRFGSEHPLERLWKGWSGAESEAVVAHAQTLPVGFSLEENTQPFRFRKWLFAHVGEVMGFSAMRNRLISTIPEFLQRQIRGDSSSEVAFALFLKMLREVGRTDDDTLEAPLAAQLLGKTVRAIEQHASDAGATGKPTLNLVATNGHMLIATRYGSAPLYYTLLEGNDRCERCDLVSSAASELLPLATEHRRCRTVAIASNVTRPAGWIELPHGTALAVGGKFNIQSITI